MTASVYDVLEAAKQHNIKITVAGDILKLRAPCEPPAEVVEQLRQWKPHIIQALSEVRFCAWSFTLDNCRSITAIRPQGATLEEMKQHLSNQFGYNRISNLRASK